jgi:hypothetical protein
MAAIKPAFSGHPILPTALSRSALLSVIARRVKTARLTHIVGMSNSHGRLTGGWPVSEASTVRFLRARCGGIWLTLEEQSLSFISVLVTAQLPNRFVGED